MGSDPIQKIQNTDPDQTFRRRKRNNPTLKKDYFNIGLQMFFFGKFRRIFFSIRRRPFNVRIPPKYPDPDPQPWWQAIWWYMMRINVSHPARWRYKWRSKCLKRRVPGTSLVRISHSLSPKSKFTILCTINTWALFQILHLYSRVHDARCLSMARALSLCSLIEQVNFCF